MLARFAGATAVAAVVIALTSLALLFVPLPTGAAGRSLLTTAWCFVPVIWGVWALLTPHAWMPQRLPLWGAILGLIAGIMAAFVLDFPERIAGVSLNMLQRALALPLAMAIYYLLWMIVRRVCEALTHPQAA